jgi:hypothetical protein
VVKGKLFTGLISLLLVIPSIWPADAEQERPRNVLFYTYIGPFAGAGYNIISYSEWNSQQNVQETRKVSGMNLSGGCSFQIYANNFAGDRKAGYMYNMNDGTHVIQHPFFSIYGKYLWMLRPELYAGTGLGLYMETPPATSGYDGGAGVQVPASLVYNLGMDSKFFTDLEFRYGRYQYGNNYDTDSAYKFSVQLSLGYIFKIGRL